MKKYSIFLSAAFAVLALASCQKVQEISNTEIIDDTPKSVPFVLRANIPSVDTKTTLNTSTWAVDWEDTDVIYAVTTDEAWGEPYNDDKDANTIAEFAYDSANGIFSTDMAIADGSHTFNFLYTAGQQKSYHRGAGTTFQLYGTQTFDASDPTASLKLYDAMAAQVTATTPTSFADVDMSHLFSLMKVTLKNKTGASVTVNKFEIEIPGENLYGIFDVAFATTPSASYNKNGGDKITVNISNGTIDNGSSLDVYFVMGAVTDYTGEVTFTVTDSADNTYTKTNTISAPGVSFAAGTYNTASYTLKAGVSYPTIDNTSSDYTTGFETGFSTGTTYNNTTVKVDGPDGQKWGSYYGTASTNNALTESNSMQMRWYTSAESNLGYAETDFFIAKVGLVSFSAAATNGLKVGLYYKGKSDLDWTLAETFTPTTEKATYSHGFLTPIDNARIKFQIVLPTSAPGSTSNLRIDDVVVKPVAPAPTISVTTVAATATSSADGTSATLNGSLALLNGAVNSSVTEAGFYFKLTSAGGYTKVTCASAPTSTTDFSYDLTGLTKDSEYTYYAYAIYDGSSEITGEATEKTFTPTKDSGMANVTQQTFTFSELGYSNAADVTTIAGTSNCSIVFAKGTGSTAPKYYNSGTAVRSYAGNTITVTASTGYKITSITLSFGSSDGSNEIGASVGTYDDGTWSGTIENGASVVFTIKGTSGNRRISSIQIN